MDRFKPNEKEIAKIGKWIMFGEHGASSMTLAGFYLFQLNENLGSYNLTSLSYPSDPSDFHRCMLFLDKCVDAENQFLLIRELGTKHKKWENIANYWYQLLKLYDEEKEKTRAPKRYAFMKKILAY